MGLQGIPSRQQAAARGSTRLERELPLWSLRNTTI
jgi:hypothetical protein